MKYFVLMCAIALTVPLSTRALAEDKNIIIFDSNIIQEQSGLNLTQEAVIGTISGNFQGNVTILISGSNIVQVQNGSGSMQRARIGTVTCNCGP